MACQDRDVTVRKIATQAMKELRNDKSITHAEAKVLAFEAANQIVDRAMELADEAKAPKASESIVANASTEKPMPEGDRPSVVMTDEVLRLSEAYLDNPTSETKNALLNAEIANEYRNSKGELLVNFEAKRPAALGSIDDTASIDEAEEFYFDTDGTLSKSDNINNALIELDRKNMGENFDEEFSAELTGMLKSIVGTVQTLQDNKVKITKQQIDKVARGTFDPSTNEITVRVDEGKADTFRNKFTQTNQEIYIHELTHAATEFMFSGDLKAGRDTETVALVASVKTLYATARKNTTSWKDMLPGFSDGTSTYTLHEQEQAKQKFDYIFNSKNSVGLEEFMSHLLTNKMFREAMRNVSALGTKELAEDKHIINKIIDGFKNFLAKLSGFATHTRDESITDAGTDLLFKVMRAQMAHATKSVGLHPVEATEKVAEYVMDKLDNLDEALRPAVDSLISTPLQQTTEKGKEKVAEMTKAERTSAAIEVVASALAKQKAANKRDLFVLKFKSTGKTTAAKQVKNTLVNSAVLLNNLYAYAVTAGDLCKAKELDPAGYAKAIKHFSVILKKVEESVVGSIMRDFMAKDSTYNKMTDAILTLTHAVDKLREGSYEEVLAESAEWFGRIPINKDSHKKQNQALSDVILRTDIQSLGLDAKELVELLRDPKTVAAKIAELKAVINNKEMSEDAMLLATYMTTGVGGIISNAENIARGFGRNYNSWDTPDAALVKAIDELVTYEAIQMTAAESKATLVDFIDGKGYADFKESALKELEYKYKVIDGSHISEEEYKANINDGVNSFIDFAYGSQVQSAAELKEDQSNVIKGYMRESFDPGIEVIFKPIRDRKELESNGYTFVRNTTMLPNSSVQYGMFTKVDGKNKRVNGAIGLQGTKSRGFTLLDKVNEESRDAEVGSRSDFIYKQGQFKMALDIAKKEYLQDRTNYPMSPIYDSTGVIVNFRVTMSHEEKAAYLDMESRGTQNLARTYGIFGTAEATLKHNMQVLDDIKEDADSNYSHLPQDYVVIKPRDTLSAEDFGLDGTPNEGSMTKYEQIWARLPKSTQQYAASLYKEDGSKYGTNQIVIRKDLLEAAFGEDEISLADARITDKLGAKARASAKHFERYWQDFMQIAKSNIVIKTPDVLLGNIVSNAKILYYTGGNPVKSVKLISLGYRELGRHENDTAELHKLERIQETIKDKGSTKFKHNTARIAELNRAIDENLVTPLINAGLLQSIVEDVSTKRETNRVSNFTNTMVDKYIPNETANTAIQYMFLTERTKPFKAMLKMTQVSDFWFRFAQYYDAIDNRGKSPEEALRDVTEDYINYEAPINRWVRYGDRMGLWFFVKYFIGIQKVIKKIAKKHPGRLGAEVLGEFMLGDIDGIEDQSVLVKGLNTYNFDIAGHIMDVVSPPGVDLVGGYL